MPKQYNHNKQTLNCFISVLEADIFVRKRTKDNCTRSSTNKKKSHLIKMALFFIMCLDIISKDPAEPNKVYLIHHYPLFGFRHQV
jgi:hypothetical protein